MQIRSKREELIQELTEIINKNKEKDEPVVTIEQVTHAGGSDTSTETIDTWIEETFNGSCRVTVQEVLELCEGVDF